jgi:hypothetical protein
MGRSNFVLVGSETGFAPSKTKAVRMECESDNFAGLKMYV